MKHSFIYKLYALCFSTSLCFQAHASLDVCAQEDEMSQSKLSSPEVDIYGDEIWISFNEETNPDFISVEGIRQQLTQYPHTTHFSIRTLSVGDEVLEVLSEFPNIQYLFLEENCFRDEGAKFLRVFHNLKEIDISRNYITSTGIAHIPLNNLEELRANFLELGNETMQKISLGSKISYLGVAGTGIDENALPYFQKMTALKSLDISYNKISSAAIETLRSARPDMRITVDHMK